MTTIGWGAERGSRILEAFKRLCRPDGSAAPGASVTPVEVLDQYISAAPSPQVALDLFHGGWSSRLPHPFDRLEAGQAELFEDARIRWLQREIGGLDGKAVLELGPLEGGHTYMLERAGASEIVAVEANTRAFLKCLIVKELLDLKRARFLCGDFVEYMRTEQRRFDVCIASGVLYHMRDPAELIALISEHCAGHVLLWTHYFDEEIVSASATLRGKFSSVSTKRVRGFEHQLHRYEYGAALGWSGFCGGSAPFSEWMTRDQILRCLEHFGFGDIRISLESTDHPNGPAFTVIAARTT